MGDIIAAIATGGGVSAVGIIRVSGDGAIGVIDRVFRAKSGVPMGEAPAGRLYYGELLDSGGAVLDLCLCTVSRGPKSYTGEDTAELHCHGSPVVLGEGLRALFSAGARQALAGEFTKRAFLNGRMDLSQAEAVADLIEAGSREAAVNAAGQLGGAVSRKTREVYEALVDITAHYFAAVDYPEEDIDDLESERCAAVLRGAADTLEELLSTYDRGRVLKDGVKTAIIGRPNVGKSSLLNALAGYERAIVTPVAGTTRDTIEEKIRLGPVLLRLVDTAGIRRTEDTVERLGVDRARGAAEGAQLILAVFDGHAPLTAEDGDILALAESAPKRLAVLNKSDLGACIDRQALESRFDGVVAVSALTGGGIGDLSDAVGHLFGGGLIRPAGEILTNVRQAEAIGRALLSIRQASDALERGITLDAVLTDVETALSSIGEITGKTAREDVTARIFERFCVGK